MKSTGTVDWSADFGSSLRIQYLEKRLRESNEENIDLMDKLKSAVSRLNEYNNKSKNVTTVAVQVCKIPLIK